MHRDTIIPGSVANSHSRRDAIGFAASGQAANMSNCSASEIGLKATSPVAYASCEPFNSGQYDVSGDYGCEAKASVGHGA